MLSSGRPPPPCGRSSRDTWSFDVKPLEEPGQVSLGRSLPGERVAVRASRMAGRNPRFRARLEPTVRDYVPNPRFRVYLELRVRAVYLEPRIRAAGPEFTVPGIWNLGFGAAGPGIRGSRR
jgi:hypothetical protein